MGHNNKGNFHSKKNDHSKDRTSNFESRPANQKKLDRSAKVNGGVFVYSKPLSVGELSSAINVPIPQIIKYFFMQGKMVTINQVLEDDMIGEICLEFGYDFKKEKIVVINPTHNGVKTNKINPDGLFMLSYAAAKIIKLSTNPNPRIIKV